MFPTFTPAAHLHGATDPTAQRVNGTAQRVNGTAQRVNGTAQRANGTAQRVNGTAQRVNGSVARAATLVEAATLDQAAMFGTRASAHGAGGWSYGADEATQAPSVCTNGMMMLSIDGICCVHRFTNRNRGLHSAAGRRPLRGTRQLS